MSTPEKALSGRIRELRRRHYGAKGKDEFARRLGLSRAEYDSLEEGRLPSGELMVRMCEITGEDLQWLLTGVSARGTVVISGTRRRHRDLLTRIARSLDEKPKLATPLEAFFELLTHSGGQRRQTQSAELSEAKEELLPIYGDVWPEQLPGSDDSGGTGLPAPKVDRAELVCAARVTNFLIEPDLEGRAPALRRIDIVSIADASGRTARYVESAELAKWFPGAFGLVLHDEAMKPMCNPGDVLLVVPGEEPQLGRPAACKCKDPDEEFCRIWLGREGDRLRLARVADGASEEISSERLCWALDVMYRLTPAA